MSIQYPFVTLPKGIRVKVINKRIFNTQKLRSNIALYVKLLSLLNLVKYIAFRKQLKFYKYLDNNNNDINYYRNNLDINYMNEQEYIIGLL